VDPLKYGLKKAVAANQSIIDGGTGLSVVPIVCEKAGLMVEAVRPFGLFEVRDDYAECTIQNIG
jgi:hypothetical protein